MPGRPYSTVALDGIARADVVPRHFAIDDPEQPVNRNALLATTVGKGRFIYTSISVAQQVANGVPGAMRLLVNLLSAGLSEH